MWLSQIGSLGCCCCCSNRSVLEKYNHCYYSVAGAAADGGYDDVVVAVADGEDGGVAVVVVAGYCCLYFEIGNREMGSGDVRISLHFAIMRGTSSPLQTIHRNRREDPKTRTNLHYCIYQK